MSQKYDEYLEKHRQAVKKAYQWIAAYIPELTDVEATRNIEFHGRRPARRLSFTSSSRMDSIPDMVI